MRNILFTPPADEKILTGEKTMTARHWLQPPPKVGELVTASTGRKKETRFAILQIASVSEWNGNRSPLFTDAEKATGIMLKEIAKREGFKSWFHFTSAYLSLNADRYHEAGRTHWFIGFKLAPEVRCYECGVYDLKRNAFYGGIEEGGGDWADENVQLWYCSDCAANHPRFEDQLYGGGY